MKFFYQFARLPDNQELLFNIDAAADRLYNKLKDLDISSLAISDYSKKYLSTYISSLDSTLQRYSYILAWILACSDIELNHFVLVDYGGGTGTLSMLAREMQIGVVIYSDIYDVSCEDAKVIGESIGNKADYYLNGEIDDVITFLKRKSLPCNAITSNDVIEHIYDIEIFFKKLKSLSNGPLIFLMATSANPFNPVIRKGLMKKQVEFEYTCRSEGWGHKKRDNLKAYFNIRKDIISHYAQNLTSDEIERLARATRGMIEEDIKKSVDEYLRTKCFPKEPSHPTNTCDPYTGNWAEHLMDPYQLRESFSKDSFEVKILCGYHGQSKSSIKKPFVSLVNKTISLLGNQGIRLAPFYAIYGRK
jgi:2-polyprenyl-3-methyl-5-hydroxy-6-metoxy-1,4-benzoquinol methylase